MRMRKDQRRWQCDDACAVACGGLPLIPVGASETNGARKEEAGENKVFHAAHQAW